MRFAFLLAAASLATLAACGGSDAPFQDDTALKARIDAAAAQYDRVSGLNPTAIDRMPTSGSATFRGQAGLGVYRGVPTGDPDYSMIGSSTVTADFARSRVTGKIDNLQGFSTIGRTGFTVPVTGSVTLGGNQSAIGDNPRTATREAANVFSSDFDASITVDGNLLRSRGGVSGRFAGNRVKSSPLPAPVGVIATGVGSATLDGEPATFGFDLYGSVK